MDKFIQLRSEKNFLHINIFIFKWQIDDKLLSEEEMLTHDARAVSDTKDHAQIQTYDHVSLPFDPEDVSEFPQSPTEVQSKMMTKQDLMIILPNVPVDSSNNTCKDVNQVNTHSLRMVKFE